MQLNLEKSLQNDRPGGTLPVAFGRPLLKWVGSKQRVAPQIISCFPDNFRTYFEPFLGSGGVLGTLAPKRAVASDSFEPLMKLWQTLSVSPETVKQWYRERWELLTSEDKVIAYESIKASYNACPNPADLLFLSRSCYGGVVRFRRDGYMSTPCGPHDPIKPQSFSERVDEWHTRTNGTSFEHMEFSEAFERAEKGDLVYCDPPYAYSQTILYGAQGFVLQSLFDSIKKASDRGVLVALSIDGTKKSGDMICNVVIPSNLFRREVVVNVGRSMLRRFQMNGRSLESEVVSDRLMLNY